MLWGERGREKRGKKLVASFSCFPTTSNLRGKKKRKEKDSSPSANSQKAYPFELPVILSMTRLNAASLP